MKATVYDQFGNTMQNVLVTFEMLDDQGATGPVNSFPNHIGLRNIGGNFQYQEVVTEPTDEFGEATIIARKSWFTPAGANAFVTASAVQNENMVQATEGDEDGPVHEQEIIWVQVPFGIELSPFYELNFIGDTTHTVDAQIIDQYGNPVLVVADIEFTATDQTFGAPVVGPETESTSAATGATDWTYSRDVEAEDEITATSTVTWDYGTGNVDYNISEVDPVFKDWVILNVQLSPPDSFNNAEVDSHTVTAQLVDGANNPFFEAGVEVTWSFDAGFQAGDLFAGPVVSNELQAWDGTKAVSETDGAGQATFTYTGAQRATNAEYPHSIEGQLPWVTATVGVDTASKTWRPNGVQVFHLDTDDDEAFNRYGETHTYVAQVVDHTGTPIEAPDVTITFDIDGFAAVQLGDQDVHDPADAPVLADPGAAPPTGQTNHDGQLAFSDEYFAPAGVNPGDEETHTLLATLNLQNVDVDLGDVGGPVDFLLKTWYESEVGEEGIVLTAGTQQWDDDNDWWFFDYTATVVDQHGVLLAEATVDFATVNAPPGGQFWNEDDGLTGGTDQDETNPAGQAFARYVSDPASDFPLYPMDVHVQASSGGVNSNVVERTFVDDPVEPTGLVLTATPNPQTSGTTFILEAQAQYLGNDLNLADLDIEFEMTSGYSNFVFNRVGLCGMDPAPGAFYQIWNSSTDGSGVAQMRALRGLFTPPPRSATVIARYNGIESNTVDLEWVTGVTNVSLSAGGQFTTVSDPATNWPAFEFNANVTGDLIGLLTYPIANQEVTFNIVGGSGAQFWDPSIFVGLPPDETGLVGGSFTAETDAFGNVNAYLVSFGETAPLFIDVQATSDGVDSNIVTVEFNY